MDKIPIITKEKQTIYEKIFSKHATLKNSIPEICGYYGRGCRHMDKKANTMLCSDCSLSIFISIVEAIIERCNEKENIGIEHLHDSDIYDIQKKLEEISIKADFSYIQEILEALTEGE